MAQTARMLAPKAKAASTEVPLAVVSAKKGIKFLRDAMLDAKTWTSASAVETAKKNSPA